MIAKKKQQYRPSNGGAGSGGGSGNSGNPANGVGVPKRAIAIPTPKNEKPKIVTSKRAKRKQTK